MARHLRLTGLALIMAASLAQADAPMETLTKGLLPQATPYRVYLSDLSFSHMVDGKLHVLNTDSGRYEGMIATGLTAQQTLSPDRRWIYNVTTYYSRLNHGQRTDIAEIYDASTLELAYEIPVPNKHAQAVSNRHLLATSYDGRYLFTQNATPAASVTVVDLVQHKVVSEVNTPGCWSIIPSANVASRFATVCGDGTFMTIDLDEAGQVTKRTRSDKWFDPDKDPVFVHGERLGDKLYYVSFSGVLHQLDFSGEKITQTKTAPLVTAADAKKAWRPGGYQLMAIDTASQRLFIGMHSGGKEGSHKSPAEQIWSIDLKTGQRLSRSDGHFALSLAIGHAGAPRLYAMDARDMSLVVFDIGGKTPKVKRVLPKVAETGLKLEVQ